MYYFAYGSNMSATRLLRRIPAEKLGTGVLRGYQLAFTKPGELDGSAKCDICPSANEDSAVYGVLYDIREEHKPTLDRYEGLGYGYRTENVEIEFRGETVTALTYIAMDCRPELLPFEWYRQHVYRGALENGLPAEYLSMIETTPAKRDPDQERRAEELSIYQ